MAYDEQLADRVREHLADTRVTEKKMFGGLAFLVGGNMAVAVSGQGGLLVRVDVSESDRLLLEPGAAPMRMGRRGPMTGWLHVAADAVATDEPLDRWVRRGVAYAKALPAK